MKVGSIVECIDNSDLPSLPIPKLNTPYTVSFIAEGSELDMAGRHTGKRALAIQLEEIPTGDKGYRASCFRELQPPIEIQDALDSCEPVLITL